MSAMLTVFTISAALPGGCGQTPEPTPSAPISSSREQEPLTSSESLPSSSVSVSVPENQENGCPESFFITDENYFDYQPGMECAAFASAYLLRHFGEEADGLQLYETFPGKLSNGYGVMPSGIEQFFNEHEGGYSAEFRTDGTIEELKQLVSIGVPVIVFVHVEEPYESPHYTHYLPFVGYDTEYLYFAESLDYLANCKDEPDLPYNRKTEIEKFKRLWDNIDDFWDNPYFVVSKDESR